MHNMMAFSISIKYIGERKIGWMTQIANLVFICDMVLNKDEDMSGCLFRGNVKENGQEDMATAIGTTDIDN